MSIALVTGSLFFVEFGAEDVWFEVPSSKLEVMNVS
jgi:hypothetical protein